MSDLSNLDTEVIRTALTKMFRPDSYLDICTIEKCLKIAKVPARGPLYDRLAALHCVHWRDMSPTLRQEVAKAIVGMFDEPVFDPMETSLLTVHEIAVVTENKSGILNRLLRS